jgi:hypothetical protein
MSISVVATPVLATRWVRWLAASGPHRNPIKDPDGRHTQRNQPDDVFFLAGTYGGDTLRRCAVPAGRPLFFPAFSVWRVGGEPTTLMPEAYGRAYVDRHEHPVVEADSGPEPFVVRGAWRNEITHTRTPTPVRVWGLWATVAPLPPGRHSVRFAGGTGKDFQTAATYELEVG